MVREGGPPMLMVMTSQPSLWALDGGGNAEGVEVNDAGADAVGNDGGVDGGAGELLAAGEDADGAGAVAGVVAEAAGHRVDGLVAVGGGVQS